jgi:DNA-binding transcriptional regulator YbjK
MSRRTEITDAAIRTLAAEGMRGLTHRAVDRAAEIPEGSTSYYFRTRSALLAATVDRLAELDTAELPAPVADLDTFTAALAARMYKWTTTDRPRQLARYELTLEATRRPDLREVLAQGDAAIRVAVADLLRATGMPAPTESANVLVACIDGLLFDQTVGAGGRELGVDDLRAILRRLVDAVAGPAGSHHAPKRPHSSAPD